MSDRYLTISSPSEAVFTEKRSKFLAFAFPVKTPEDAKEKVADLSKRFFDARHVCWAYMIGPSRTDFRANDNGEPSGTAGKPILGQINSFELTDVIVAVVRYFGGIKLGTSGLITSYRQAARLCLENADIVERHVTVEITFNYPYISMNEVMKITRESGVSVVNSTFDNTCSMTLSVRKDCLERIETLLNSIDGVTVEKF